MNALGIKNVPTLDGKHVPTAEIKVEDLNLETPLSSLNVTPDNVCIYEMIKIRSKHRFSSILIVLSGKKWRRNRHGRARNPFEFWLC